MKKFTISLLALAALISFHQANAQTADEIIDKHITALGGKEKLLALKSIKKTGSINVQGMDVGITITVLNGVGFRNDIFVPGMGEGFQITTPAKAWNFMPFQGQTSPEEISGEQLKSLQYQLDLPGVLVNYKEKGSQVELSGKEKVDSIECYKLKLTSKSGRIYTMFIDPETWYCIRMATKTLTPTGEEDSITSYADFKPTPDGYVFPFSQTISRGRIIFSSIEINVPVDEKIFKVN